MTRRRSSDPPSAAMPTAGAAPSVPPSALVVSDLPAVAAEDWLDFRPYRAALRSIINHPKTGTPLTIGVFGSWGVGKTSLLGMLKENIENPEKTEGRRNCTVWFNAWKYDREDGLWRALILRVVEAVRAWISADWPTTESGAVDVSRLSKEQKRAWEELGDLEETLYRAVDREELGEWRFDGMEFVKGGVEIGAQALQLVVPGLSLGAKVIEALQTKVGAEGPGRLLSAFERERVQVKMAQAASIEQFEGKFTTVVRDYVQPHGRLVVFVDDLDRCLPEKAIEVLEAIKLFLNVPSCVFVLAVDRAVIAQGIRVKYEKLERPIDGDQYLEKIIQLPFDLPALVRDDIERYVRKLMPEDGDARCTDVFTVGLTVANPRRIKRGINVFLLLSILANERRERFAAHPVRLAKIVVIKEGYRELYELLRAQPGRLAELEQHVRTRARAGDELSRTTAERPDLWESLVPYANQPGIERLLHVGADDDAACFHNAGVTDIEPYFVLVRTVVDAPAVLRPGLLVPETVVVPNEGAFRMGTSDEDLQWMAKNTDWAKKWKLDGWFDDEMPRRNVTVSEFAIGRYPVTNREYQAFVEAAGHSPPRHWSGATPPDDLTNHPVVYVNHADALAYCAWLSEVTDREWRLPTEAEWEKAARGMDGRFYPWGGPKFDAKRCNTAEGGIGNTTPVGKYSEAGDSPYGCADMAGNVWEWCADWYVKDYYTSEDLEDPKGPANGNARVVRGGSWLNYSGGARCACRSGNVPDFRGDNLGFRVVVAAPTHGR